MTNQRKIEIFDSIINSLTAEEIEEILNQRKVEERNRLELTEQVRKSLQSFKIS